MNPENLQRLFLRLKSFEGRILSPEDLAEMMKGAFPDGGMERKTFPFEVKGVEKDGTIKGYASTFGNVDQGGDVVMPGAFSVTIAAKKGKFPILADHSPSNQIGWNDEAVEDAKGLLVHVTLDILVNQKAKEKHSLAKMGLDRGAEVGLSIGYEALKYDFLQDDGTTTSHRTWRPKEVRRLKEIKLWEYSLVTFPMNEEALVTGAKNWHEHLTTIDNVEGSSKFFLETMKAKGYSEAEVRKAVLASLAEPATSVQDPGPDAQSFGETLEEIKKLFSPK